MSGATDIINTIINQQKAQLDYSSFIVKRKKKQICKALANQCCRLSNFPFEKLTAKYFGDKRSDRISKAVCLFRGFCHAFKIILLSLLTNANEAMFTFLIRCLNKDKACSQKNSKPCNPNTSIESVTKDVTAFFFTNNNERLISILMREEKGK